MYDRKTGGVYIPHRIVRLWKTFEKMYTYEALDPMLPNLQGCLGSTLFIQAKMSFLTHIHWCTL